MRCMVRRLRGTRSSIDYRGVYSADRITFIVVRHDGLDFFAQLVKFTVQRVGRAKRPWASGFEGAPGTFYLAEQFPHAPGVKPGKMRRPQTAGLRRVDANARNVRQPSPRCPRRCIFLPICDCAIFGDWLGGPREIRHGGAHRRLRHP